MTDLQMKYVLTLAELKSFSKAAKKLYITQPSLSQYIAGIEKQVGTLLFDRTTNPISLTAAGQAYADAARQILSIEDELKNKLSDYENLDGGTLKIGASTFRSSYMLARSISEFCKSHPGVAVTISDDNPDDLAEKLINGSIDILIATGKFSSENFDVEELATERMYIAAAPDIELSDKVKESCLCADDVKKASMKAIGAKPVCFDDFEGIPFIFTQGGEFSSENVGSKVTPALVVRTIGAAFAYVATGFGATVVPDSLIKFGNIANHPDYYPLDPAKYTKPVYLVTRRKSYMSKAAKEYCLTLKRLIASGTWRLK